jgi:hypothetical protein
LNSISSATRARCLVCTRCKRTINVTTTDRYAPCGIFVIDNSIVESSVPGIGNGNYTREVYDNLFSVSKLVVNMPGSGAINNLVLRNTQSVEVSAPATLAFISLGLAFIGYRRFK